MNTPPPSSRAGRPPGTVSHHRLDDEVIETIFEGYMTSALVDAADEAYFALVGARASRFNILNGEKVTGIEPSIGLRGTAAIKRFREAGGEEYLMVSTSGILRMMGAALIAASQTPFRMFETRAAAIAYAAARRHAK